jgi:hypothetical protein
MRSNAHPDGAGAAGASGLDQDGLAEALQLLSGEQGRPNGAGGDAAWYVRRCVGTWTPSGLAEWGCVRCAEVRHAAVLLRAVGPPKTAPQAQSAP